MAKVEIQGVFLINQAFQIYPSSILKACIFLFRVFPNKRSQKLGGWHPMKPGNSTIQFGIRISKNFAKRLKPMPACKRWVFLPKVCASVFSVHSSVYQTLAHWPLTIKQAGDWINSSTISKSNRRLGIFVWKQFTLYPTHDLRLIRFPLRKSNIKELTFPPSQVPQTGREFSSPLIGSNGWVTRPSEIPINFKLVQNSNRGQYECSKCCFRLNSEIHLS